MRKRRSRKPVHARKWHRAIFGSYPKAPRIRRLVPKYWFDPKGSRGNPVVPEELTARRCSCIIAWCRCFPDGEFCLHDA